MEKIMKIPFYVPFLGIVISFVTLIILTSNPNPVLLISSLILLHVCGLLYIAKFIFSGIGFFSSVLNTK